PAPAPVPAPPPSTTPPSTPTGLSTSGVGQTAVTLSWAASTDNLGVAGYRLFRAGVQVGTTSGLSYSFSGLACGTSYVLAVAAFDAAGNVSALAAASVVTSGCSSPPAAGGGGTAANLWVGLAGGASCVRSAVPVDYATAA